MLWCIVGTALPLRLGEVLGRELRARVLAELGLTVTVGVARNRFLAKLISSACKPDGLQSLDGTAAVRRLLEATPVTRIPGTLTACVLLS
jgi:DNA polymerase IV